MSYPCNWDNNGQSNLTLDNRWSTLTNAVVVPQVAVGEAFSNRWAFLMCLLAFNYAPSHPCHNPNPTIARPLKAQQQILAMPTMSQGGKGSGCHRHKVVQ
jgi:hypothetical protein